MEPCLHPFAVREERKEGEVQRMPKCFGMKIHSSGIRAALSITKIAHHLDPMMILDVHLALTESERSHFFTRLLLSFLAIKPCK